MKLSSVFRLALASVYPYPPQLKNTAALAAAVSVARRSHQPGAT